MANPRTPSTSDFSTLETKDRNDNTTIGTKVTEVPDSTTGNEFEVERRNEVPDQSQNKSLTENEKLEKVDLVKNSEEEFESEDDDKDVEEDA